jgi:hypothetical protein
MDRPVTIGTILVVFMGFEPESIVRKFDDNLIVEKVDLIPQDFTSKIFHRGTSIRLEKSIVKVACTGDSTPSGIIRSV